MARTIQRRLRELFCLMLALFVFSTPAAAAQNSSLALSYPYDGVTFQVYRVAEATGSGYTLTEDFAAYAVTVPGESPRDTAATLASYAARDAIAPTVSGVTADGGVTLRDLADGLYLVVGVPHVSDWYTCTPIPFLTEISGGRAEATVKYERDTVEEEPVSVTVEKIWANDAGQTRPGSVTVQLLCNGEAVQTATLNAWNGWKHTWKNLSANDLWQVTEQDVPSGYTVTVSQSGYTFTVTNTYRTGSPTPTSTPGSTATPTGFRLPKTGDDFPLGALVALLVAADIGLGVTIYRKRKDK